MPKLARRSSFVLFGALALACGPKSPVPPGASPLPDRTAEILGVWRGRGGPFGAEEVVRFEFKKGRWESRHVGDGGGYTGSWKLDGRTLRMAMVMTDPLGGEPNHWSFELSKDGKRLTATSGVGGTLTKAAHKKVPPPSSGASQKSVRM